MHHIVLHPSLVPASKLTLLWKKNWKISFWKDLWCVGARSVRPKNLSHNRVSFPSSSGSFRDYGTYTRRINSTTLYSSRRRGECKSVNFFPLRHFYKKRTSVSILNYSFFIRSVSRPSVTKDRFNTSCLWCGFRLNFLFFTLEKKVPDTPRLHTFRQVITRLMKVVFIIDDRVVWNRERLQLFVRLCCRHPNSCARKINVEHLYRSNRF